MDMLEQRYDDTYGKDCFRNCDVVDLTFACIGAVDAMHKHSIGSPEAAKNRIESESWFLLTMQSTILDHQANILKEPVEVQF